MLTTRQTTPLRLLVVGDSGGVAGLVVEALRLHGYAPECEHAEDARAMSHALERHGWDVVVSIGALPPFDLPQVLAVRTRCAPEVPLLVVSGPVGEEAAAAAIRAGASDFILKRNLARLGPAVERELREAEARRDPLGPDSSYRDLFEGGPLPAWVVDRSSLAFLAVNDAAIRHYGYRRDELARMTLRDLRGRPEGRARRAQGGDPGDADDMMRAMEGRLWWHRKKDGTTIQVEVHARDLVVEGRGARLIVASDVTERRLAREALRRNEERAQHARTMAAVGRFAGGVAHDFNDVLSVILSYATLLLEELPSSDRHRTDVLEIERSAKRAAAMTRELLAVSHEGALEPRALDVNDVVAGMEPMLRRMARENVFLSTLSPRSLARIRADRDQIEQIVLNLVLNARDAMPAGGTITIETANVTLEEARAREVHEVRETRETREIFGAHMGPHVMIAVTDTGSGMDRATRARIFEPFFTTKSIGEGTGLGLATVFGIVQRYRGSISVYSELGRGTTFKIFLPSCDGGGAFDASRPERSLPVQDRARAAATDVPARSLRDVFEA